MKKLIAIFLSLVLMTGMLAACASAEGAETAETDAAAWTLPETIEMTEEAAAAFTKAMEGLVGVNYEALGFLGEKDGTWCILCRATAVYPDAKPYYALVYVNDDGVQNIWDIWMDKHANP
jgi:hypothetical protein